MKPLPDPEVCFSTGIDLIYKVRDSVRGTHRLMVMSKCGQG